MEFMKVPTLERALSTEDNAQLIPKEATVWSYLIQLLSALNTLHSKGLCHKSVNPRNIFVVPSTIGSGVDILKLGAEAKTVTPFKHIEALLSKPSSRMSQLYEAPEVLRGETYTHQSDVWALGCVVYEMMALRPPFSATTTEELVA